MLFGDRNEFAIEADVEPDLTPPSAVWGRICLWCRGEAMGRCDERYCALDPAAGRCEWLRDSLGDLWDEPLRGLEDTAARELLERVSYFQDGRDRIPFCRYDKFKAIDGFSESMDGWSGFIVCPPGEDARILYRRPDGSLGSARVSRDSIRRAADEFVRWFNAQEARLCPGPLSS